MTFSVLQDPRTNPDHFVVTRFVKKHYDWKMGLIGALIMAGVVYAINADHGFWAAIPAALKQGVYTLIAGGCLTRLTERLALTIDDSVLAHFTATSVPVTIAVILTLLLHYMKGTPEPFNSTIPTMIMAPPSFFWWAWRQRRRKWEPRGTVAIQGSEV